MIHLPFKDRVEAGCLLADEIARRKDSHDAIVLALTRGGVPVGYAVADRLRIPLDIIIARKIGVPWQPELAMGAMAGSTRVLDERMIRELGIQDEEVARIVAREQAEIKRREELYRGGRPARAIEGRTALLIDDGLATGNTMLASVRHARTMRPKKIIIGVPVGSSEACARLRDEADDVICLATPELFFAVGEWYEHFEQVSDSEVQKLLADSRRDTNAAAAHAGPQADSVRAK
ncbi:MAG TPA: phosphoribosyltransferase [Bryobacteraceae bacterium]|jgi:putative phosphoribosyl transferase|nr:phosphoribosyltransferase [Bryobacteraceae bacterium]